jgi:hypothetical protein
LIDTHFADIAASGVETTINSIGESNAVQLRQCTFLGQS